MKSSNVWRFFLSSFFIVIVYGVLMPQSNTLPFGLSDLPVILPPYYSFAARDKLSGTVEFKLDFEDGKVVAVDLIAQNLRSEITERTSGPVIVSTVLSIKRVLRDWRALEGGSYSTSLIVELEPDSTLLKDEIHYKVQYNDKGIISRIRIRGATERSMLD